MAVTITCVTGAAIAPHLPALAALRIGVFREYPYLYEGTLAYEAGYLASYAASPDALVVLAQDGDRVVGASTAMPLLQHTEALAPTLAAGGVDPSTVCYFGESVLDRAHRGHGLGRAFFDERERHARAGGFSVAAFCAVERPADHPARPADYAPHDAFWTRRGFVRRPDLRTEMTWLDLGEAVPTAKPMVFWLKDLAR